MSWKRLEFEPYLSHMVIITLTKLLNPFQPQALLFLKKIENIVALMVGSFKF